MLCPTRRVLAAVLVATIASTSLVPSVAAAPATEKSASEKETARALVLEGRKLRDAGDHAGALERFRGAHAIMGVPTTGIEVGRTLQALGRLVEARDVLLAVSRMPVAPNEPEPFREARAAAQEFADEIAPRIPAVVLDVRAGGQTTTVTIDAHAIPNAVLGLPHKLDPGAHVAAVTAGGARREVSFTLAERETKTVVVELLPAAAPVVSPPAETSAPGSAGEPPHRSTSPLVVTGFALLGVGVIIGSVTGAVAFSRASKLRDACPGDRCAPERSEEVSSARRFATISTVSFAVAGAGAALALVTLAVSGSRNEEPRTKVSLGIGFVGLSTTF